jgi:ABC-type branched-subunit amino acid transport system substrate-binding protein
VGVSPGTEELASKVSYPIGLGGAGTTFAMVPACVKSGFKKIAAIHVDTPTITPLFAALGGMLKAYGAEMVAKIPVTAGTTDYQQFILKAQSAGAECVILPLGENEAVQVLNAAKELNSKLTYSSSLGTFSLGTVQKFGSFASQLVLNAELPPVSGDVTKWPILQDIIADLSVSGDPQLQRATLKSSPVRSWVAVYHLKTIVEKFGTPDVITREAITAAFQKATDVDSFGLIPPWTPGKPSSAIPNFKAVSNPWYYVIKYNTDTKAFEVLPDQINVLNELTGKITYPQPAK